MSTVVYYFSGTGNSLFVAKTLGAMVPDPVHIHPIARNRSGSRILISENRVIVVFPVYFQTIPDIVAGFFRDAVFAMPSPDIYAIATCNGGPGHSMFTMKRILENRGRTLRAGFCITMPGNSLILRDYMNSEEEQNRRLRECHSRIEEIWKYIDERQTGAMEGDDGFKPHLHGMITGLFAKKIYRTPSKFQATGACMRCGICAYVCPEVNITVSKEKVTWGKRCDQCLACFHWCPQEAVEIGRTTVGKRRYHHPEIAVREMFTTGESPGIM